eukprot:165425_1
MYKKKTQVKRISQPPPVTFNMLVNYKKHNTFIDNENNKNAKLKRAKRPKPPAPPRPKYKQTRQYSKSVAPLKHQMLNKNNSTNYQIREKQKIYNPPPPPSDTSDSESS